MNGLNGNSHANGYYGEVSNNNERAESEATQGENGVRAPSEATYRDTYVAQAESNSPALPQPAAQPPPSEEPGFQARVDESRAWVQRNQELAAEEQRLRANPWGGLQR